LIQRFTPFSTQCPPSRTALAFIDSASDPASGSERQYENDRPAANCVKYFDLSSSSPLSMRGSDPSLLTAGINELDTHTRAISSMTRTVANASAPAPPYRSGTCGAWKSTAVSASAASWGYRAFSSTSAAYGASLSSGSLRTASRTALCCSDRVNMLPHNWLSGYMCAHPVRVCRAPAPYFYLIA